MTTTQLPPSPDSPRSARHRRATGAVGTPSAARSAPSVPAASSARTVHVGRARSAAALRREEALARLAARRMPLPGQPLRGQLLPGQQPVHAASHIHGPGRETLVSITGSRIDTPDPPERQCACRRGATTPYPPLTAREVEVLRTWLMLDSKSAVAQWLYISLGTVNTHLTRIRAKYAGIGRAAPTKAALLARAVQDGLIDLADL